MSDEEDVTRAIVPAQDELDDEFPGEVAEVKVKVPKAGQFTAADARIGRANRRNLSAMELERKWEVKDLCRKESAAAIRRLIALSKNPQLNAMARVRANEFVVEQGWGKAVQRIEATISQEVYSKNWEQIFRAVKTVLAREFGSRQADNLIREIIRQAQYIVEADDSDDAGD